jgi:N-methylhydantoinase A
LDGIAAYSVDLRYRGQGYELNVAWDRGTPERSVEAFHALHEQRYGFCDRSKPVQIVNLRLRMTAPAEPYVPQRLVPMPGDGSRAQYAERSIYFDGEFVPSRFYRREALTAGDAIAGPAMITEYTSATLLWQQDRASVDAFGNLVIAVGASA